MTGCFGNSPYDKYFENQLFEHLDSTDTDDTEQKVDSLLEQMCDPTFAATLARDWELLVNIEGDILCAIAKARRDGERSQLLNSLLDLLWPRLESIAESEIVIEDMEGYDDE